MRGRSVLIAMAILPGLAAAWIAAASWIFLWGTGLLGRVENPFTAWLDYFMYSPRDHITVKWLWISGLAPLFLVAVVARFVMPSAESARKALYGANKWASAQQAQRHGIQYCRKPDPNGIILGRMRTWLGHRYLVLRGEEHVSLHAKTRAGKGVSVVIPNCLSWGGSLVCLDVKKENWSAAAAQRTRMGQQVFLFDPANLDGSTHRWNPFSVIERQKHGRFDQIHRIGSTWFAENPHEPNPFWTEAARDAFIAVCTIVAESPEMELTPATVLRLFARGDGGEVLSRMISQRRLAGNPYSQAAVDGVSDWLNAHHQQVSGIRKTVSTKLAIFRNPRITAATAVSDFDIRDVRRRPMSIFVGVSPGNIRRLRPLLSLFFQQLVEVNTDLLPSEDPTLRYKTLIMLDEFVRLGKVPVLAEAAAYVAGFGLRLVFVLQNVAQLRGLYGADGAEDVMDNCGAEIVFGTNDLKVCKEMSERVGFETVEGITRNKPRFLAAFKQDKQSVAIHPHKRSLLLPQEIAQLPRTQQIILRAGMMPMKTDRVVWHSDSTFSMLQGRPPRVSPIPSPVPLDDGRTRVLPAKGQKDLTMADLEPDPETVEVDDE